MLSARPAISQRTAEAGSHSQSRAPSKWTTGVALPGGHHPSVSSSHVGQDETGVAEGQLQKGAAPNGPGKSRTPRRSAAGERNRHMHGEPPTSAKVSPLM